jgi:hypothetical protein
MTIVQRLLADIDWDCADTTARRDKARTAGHTRTADVLSALLDELLEERTEAQRTQDAGEL